MRWTLYMLTFFLMQGCIVEAHKSYLPQRPIEPAFTKGQQFKCDASFSARHIELQAAISPINHLGTTFSYYYEGKGKKSLEYGILGYTAVDKGSNLFLSAKLAIATGQLIGNFERVQHTFSYTPANTLDISYYAISHQYSVYGDVSKNTTLGMLCKVAYTHYNTLIKKTDDYSSSTVPPPPFAGNYIDKKNILVKSITAMAFAIFRIPKTNLYFLLQTGFQPSAYVAEDIIKSGATGKTYYSTYTPRLNIAFGINFN